MKTHYLLYISMTGVLALGGCVADHQRAQNIEKQVDVHLNEPRNSEAPAKRQATISNDFEAAVRTSVEANERFASARALEQAALAEVGIAKSVRRPQLAGTASGGMLNQGSPVNSAVTGVAADVMITQLVYDGGASGAAMDGALAQALTARAEAQEAGNTAALEAIQAWADVWAAQEQLAVLSSRSAEIKLLLGQLDKMTTNGMLDSATRDSAKVTVLDIEMEESALRSRLAQAEARFERHFGASPSKNLSEPKTLFATPELVKISKDVSQAPGLRKLAAALVSAEAAEAQARAKFKPTVNLKWGVMSPIDKNDSTDATLGLQMQYTFNDGGRRKSEIESTMARRKATAEELASAKAEAEALRAGLLAQLQALNESTVLIDQKLEAAQSQATAAESQIALGQTSPRDLMDAQVTLYRAHEQYLKFKAERVVLQASIASGAGMLMTRLGIK